MEEKKIVQCQDCVHWNPIEPTGSNFPCCQIGGYVVGRWFSCAHGREKIKPVAKSPRGEIESLKKERDNLLNSMQLANKIAQSNHEEIKNLKESNNNLQILIEEKKEQYKTLNTDYWVLRHLTEQSSLVKENEKLKSSLDYRQKEKLDILKELNGVIEELHEASCHLVSDNVKLRKENEELNKRIETELKNPRELDTREEELSITNKALIEEIRKAQLMNMDQKRKFRLFLQQMANKYESENK